MSDDASVEGSDERLIGAIERVVFQNPDTGWCVLKVKVPGRRRLVSVVGHSAFTVAGETIEATGDWQEHSEYGERFVARSIRTTLPRSAHAAEKYLSSGLVRGVGPSLARRLVESFGAEVFEVIENAPELMRDVPGIGPFRVESICQAWKEQRALRGITEFLGAHGLSVGKAPRVFRALGAGALEVLETNPYRLVHEVPGLGFQSADRIARHLGLAMDSDERLIASLHDRLSRSLARGHSAYPVQRLLREAAEQVELAVERLIPILESEIESGRLTEEFLPEPCVFPAHLAAAERRLAENLTQLNQNQRGWRAQRMNNRSGQVKEVQIGEKLSAGQVSALEKIFSAKVAVLTGGPGTGKTTLIKSIVEEIRRQGARVRLCAPTGRAAQRLSEATLLEAQTIHRLLGWDPVDHGFRHRRSYPLSLDYLVVDEVSMIGLELMDALLEAIPRGASLLLVGDVDQLPSIQPGRVLEEIIRSGQFVHVHLEEIFRQNERSASGIIRVAHDVIHGRQPTLSTQDPGQDFHFIESRSSESCIETILKLVTERIPKRFGLDPLRQIQVLCPMNKGLVGARAMNLELQRVLNPEPADYVDRFSSRFAIGDRVIATWNDYDKEVFNGDIGRVTLIERDRSSLRVDFDGRRVDFSFTELDALSLAYAITIHKSQGSEYEAVVIPLLAESEQILSRNLLYTGITRGKRLVVLVGSRSALQFAVQNRAGLERRWSGLAIRLKNQAGELGQRQEKFEDLSF